MQTIKHKRQQVQKSLARALHGNVHRCFSKWVELVDTRMYLRNRMCVSVQRWKIATLSYGVRTWCANSTAIALHLKDQNNRTAIATKLLARMYHRVKYHVWARWREMMYTKRKLKQFVLRMKNNTLFGWYSKWYTIVQHQQELKRKIASSFCKSNKNMMRSRLNQWQRWYTVRTNLRNRMSVAVQRWSIANFRYGFEQFKTYARLHLQREEQEMLYRTQLHNTVYRLRSIMKTYYLKYGFRKWLNHNYDLLLSHQKKTHQTSIQSMTTQVNSSIQQIRSSVSTFKHKALSFHLLRTLRLCRRLVVQRAFHVWTTQNACLKSKEEQTTLRRVGRLDKIVLKKFKTNMKLKNKALNVWKEMNLKGMLLENTRFDKLNHCIQNAHKRSVNEKKLVTFCFHRLAQEHRDKRKRDTGVFLKHQHTQALHHVSRVVVRCVNRWLARKMGMMFRKWDHWSARERDREWSDRLNKMRHVVVQHTKDTKHALVNVVKQRLGMWERKRGEEEKKELN